MLYGPGVKCTECISGEDVVENSVRHELQCVFTCAAAWLGVQHLQLCLTLIELLVVAFLQSNARVRLVHGYSQFVPDALHLQAPSTTDLDHYNAQVHNQTRSRPWSKEMLCCRLNSAVWQVSRVAGSLVFETPGSGQFRYISGQQVGMLSVSTQCIQILFLAQLITICTSFKHLIFIDLCATDLCTQFTTKTNNGCPGGITRCIWVLNESQLRFNFSGVSVTSAYASTHIYMLRD